MAQRQRKGRHVTERWKVKGELGRVDEKKVNLRDRGHAKSSIVVVVKYYVAVMLWRWRESQVMGKLFFLFFWKIHLEMEKKRIGGGGRDWRGRGLSPCRQVALQEPLIICAAASGSRRGQRSASWLVGASPIRQSELRMIRGDNQESNSVY